MQAHLGGGAATKKEGIGRDAQLKLRPTDRREQDGHAVDLTGERDGQGVATVAGHPRRTIAEAYPAIGEEDWRADERAACRAAHRR